MHYVDAPGALHAACEACAGAPAVALDTEFERTSTYHPRPALLQLADRDATWLLDPLALDDLAPLAALFERSAPLIVMHSAQEDLEVLAIATGRQPKSLFDTQLAAALAGMGPGLGYHALVRELLGVELAKDQTRSDWMRRPLSAAQLRYAVDDVAHLLTLHERLHERLHALERMPWLDEETARVLRRGATDDAASRVYERLAPRAGDDAAARGRLEALCAWRESAARDLDRPRRHVLDDDLLVALARTAPTRRETLESMPEWRDRRARRHADPRALLDALREAAAAAPAAAPVPDLAPHRQALNSMRRAVADAARELAIDPSVLAPRRLLEKALVQVRVLGEPRLPEELRGWRARYLEEALMKCLRDE